MTFATEKFFGGSTDVERSAADAAKLAAAAAQVHAAHVDGDQPQPCTACQGTGDSEPAPIDCVAFDV